MKELYGGELSYKKADLALSELIEIKAKLKQFKPNEIIWNNDNLDLSPPWENHIAERITDLSNYFYTSDGKDLFEVFHKAFDTVIEIERNIAIRSI
jgi:hypothetical protein